MRKDSKHITNKRPHQLQRIHPFTKIDSKRGRKELQNNKREVNKMEIITLNVNYLSSPIKWHTVAEQELYAASERLT